MARHVSSSVAANRARSAGRLTMVRVWLVRLSNTMMPALPTSQPIKWSGAVVWVVMVISLGASDCLRASASRRSGPCNSSSIERKRADDHDDDGPQAQLRDGQSARAVTRTAIRITAHPYNHIAKRQLRGAMPKQSSFTVAQAGLPRFARNDQ